MMLAVQTVNVLNDKMHYAYNCCGKVPSFYSEMQRCLWTEC